MEIHDSRPVDYRWLIMMMMMNLMERLDKTSTAYGMQISAENTKLMTNNTNGISSNIRVNDEKLETVQSFKYLGTIVTDEGSIPEIRSRP